MRLLLDTHALLWYHLGDLQLSATARALIDDPANDKSVSAATYWEIGVKVAKGKYRLTDPFSTFIQKAVSNNGFSILPVEQHHVATLIGLPKPPGHKDPG